MLKKNIYINKINYSIKISFVIKKFVNLLLKKGKKEKAFKIVQNMFLFLLQIKKQNPVIFFVKAIKKGTPFAFLKGFQIDRFEREAKFNKKKKKVVEVIEEKILLVPFIFYNYEKSICLALRLFIYFCDLKYKKYKGNYSLLLAEEVLLLHDQEYASKLYRLKLHVYRLIKNDMYRYDQFRFKLKKFRCQFNV